MNTRKYAQCYCFDCKKPILNITRKATARCRACHSKRLKISPEANSNYKGGSLSHGYLIVICRGHPCADSRGRVRKHRLIMEEKIGRFLEPYEEVHHKDENRQNNSPNNLILTTNTEHRRKFHNHSPEHCTLCGKKCQTTRGYCGTHYSRWRLEGFPKGGPRGKDRIRL